MVVQVPSAAGTNHAGVIVAFAEGGIGSCNDCVVNGIVMRRPSTAAAHGVTTAGQCHPLRPMRRGATAWTLVATRLRCGTQIEMCCCCNSSVACATARRRPKRAILPVQLATAVVRRRFDMEFACGNLCILARGQAHWWAQPMVSVAQHCRTPWPLVGAGIGECQLDTGVVFR